ncbi:olfactory receptor 4D1-like [Thunnus albacares]|uniref:olfactory receptor 4D1-like n=1 Tax=Thunnus albacares TaxID=8236 RepID=UPI001CF6CFB2|nr:olfactory receptor 4D1-like [Thunnus albacares]
MPLQNASIKVTEFIIGGFEKTEKPFVVGVVILITYVLAVLANIMNILFIIYDKRLHKPMYLLICNLAVVDILYSSSASPTMIGVLVAGVKTISYVPCFIEMFAFHLGGVMETFALSIMAFDRLIAISCPFKYHSYLTNVRTLVLTYILWIVACAIVSGISATLLPLPHCYSKLKYTFCDYPAIIRTTWMELPVIAHSCPLCPVLITATTTAAARHYFCFECFGWDHAESGMMQPPPCSWPELEIELRGKDEITIYPGTLLPLLSNASAKTLQAASAMDEEDNLSSVSATSLTYGNLPPPSVCLDFLKVMTMASKR